MVLAHLQTKLELFEVDDIGDDGDDDLWQNYLPNFKQVLDELGPKRKHFWKASVKISSEQLRKVEKIKPFGYSRAPKKNAIYHFPRLGEIDPYGNNKFQKGVSLTNKKTCTHTKAKLQIEICFHRFCVH